MMKNICGKTIRALQIHAEDTKIQALHNRAGGIPIRALYIRAGSTTEISPMRSVGKRGEKRFPAPAGAAEKPSNRVPDVSGQADFRCASGTSIRFEFE